MHHPFAWRAITTATIVLAGAAALGLAGCTVTSSSSTCKNGSCTVKISGENAETTVLGDKVRLVLVHSDGKTAKVEVAARGSTAPRATRTTSPGCR